MPLYEYVCEEDGSVLELIRPMSQADAPVDDPEGRGRVFRRRHSTFQARGGSGRAAADQPLPQPTCGRCGQVGGPCGLR